MNEVKCGSSLTFTRLKVQFEDVFIRFWFPTFLPVTMLRRLVESRNIWSFLIYLNQGTKRQCITAPSSNIYVSCMDNHRIGNKFQTFQKNKVTKIQNEDHHLTTSSFLTDNQLLAMTLMHTLLLGNNSLWGAMTQFSVTVVQKFNRQVNLCNLYSRVVRWV